MSNRVSGGTVERLARVGELWSAIRLFHPSVAGCGPAWDEALIGVLPRVLDAVDTGAFRLAVASMLDVLHDPVTRVLPDEARSGLPTRQPPGAGEIARRAHGGVLILTLNEATVGSDFQFAVERLSAALPLLADANGLLVDLRSVRPPTDLQSEELALPIDVVIRAGGLEAALAAVPLVVPAQRLRMHFGLRGGRSERYHSGFRVLDADTIVPADRTCELPTVFLVNANTTLPRILVALQDAGRARVVAAGPVTDESLVRTHTVEVGEGIRVRFRVGELIHSDGTTGFVPDVTLPDADGTPVPDSSVPDPALHHAIELLRDVPGERPSRPKLPPLSASLVDPAYADPAYPPIGHRFLAALRIWSAIHYFFPYRDLMEEDWDQVLRTHLPRLLGAESAIDYHLAIAEMYTHIHDSHGYVQSDTLTRHFGAAPTALYTRFVEGVPVVCGFRDEEAARAASAELGDAVLEVDGEPAADRLERYARSLAASTHHRLLARASDSFLSGGDGSVARLTFRDADDRPKRVEVPRRASYPTFPIDRSGPVVRRLDERIGYLDLARIERNDAPTALESLMTTSALILDLRGYPKPGAAWPVMRRLARQDEVAVAWFETCLLLGPGESDRQRHRYLQKLEPRIAAAEAYRGRVTALIDERTQSMAEHICLFLESAVDAEFVGSPSAGANGDVTSFQVPGGITLLFSGAAVRHADGSQLQRIGIVPSLLVRPTQNGIRSGEDEVLQAAVAHLRRRL